MTENHRLKLSRRKLLQVSAVGAAAAGTGVYGSSLLAAQKQIEELKAQGWTAHPVACTMCGAYCGLLALTKDGQPTDEKSVRILPNPGHPQQGYCGRAAQAMWVWNHPLRLRKPLKRVGERGSGKFQEVSWDEATVLLNSSRKSSISMENAPLLQPAIPTRDLANGCLLPLVLRTISVTLLPVTPQVSPEEIGSSVKVFPVPENWNRTMPISVI